MTADLPLSVLCPIRHAPMRDPVLAADGYSYERDAIETWLGRGRLTSPVTGAEIPYRNVIPNHALRSAIGELVTQRSR